MTSHTGRILLRAARLVSLVLLAALGTGILMRLAPGYFSDAGELDPEYSAVTRERIKTQASHQGDTLKVSAALAVGWLHGNFGRSKQYDIPVSELIRPRIQLTAKLLLYGVGGGWLTALTLALLLGLRRGHSGEPAIAGLNMLLLTLPVGALCTACLMTQYGGPVAVLITLIAVRDFKLVYRLIRQSRMAPHLLYARAQGLSLNRIARVHLLPPLSRELLAVGVVSLVTALSAIVPVEVIFDVPGLGQLAWSAAMNRDLPVLLAVTLMMASAVGLLTATAQSSPVQVTV